MTLLRFDNVGKRYASGREALADVSFDVAPGEMLFVTGHSGAGKSTLLRLIHLTERATRGAVLFDERNIGKLRGRRVALHRRDVGVVFQDHRLLADRSVADNIALPLLLRGLHRAEIAKRVRSTLEKVGLSERGKSLPRQLSAGEQQRVGIARAIAAEPTLLLADEPTGNLDTHTGETVIELLFALNAQAGTTLVLVTHDEALARRCSRRLRLDAGRLVSQERA